MACCRIVRHPYKYLFDQSLYVNDTLLIIGIAILIAGVMVYNYASNELVEERYSLRFDLGKMNDLRNTQNVSIAVSVIGAIVALAGALDRDPLKT